MRIGWLLGIVCWAGVAVAGSPTYFRGDGGLAKNDAQPLPVEFDSAKAVQWRTPLASGHSSPCLVGDLLLVTTFEDDKLHTVALDRETGAVRWSKVSPATKIEAYHPTGSPAASSPAGDGERFYSFFGSHGLTCFDANGKTLWEKSIGPFQDEFGSSSSPVLVEGKILLNEDHDLDSFLICLDAKTGDTLWRTPREGFVRSYSTPMILDTPQGKQAIVAGALQVVAYSLETGKPLWSVDGLARIVNPTPVAGHGLVFVASWSPGGDRDGRIGMEPWPQAIKLYDKNGDGKLTREEANNKDVLDRFYRIDLNQDQFLDQTEWTKYARVFDLARNSILAIRPPAKAGEKPEVVWQYEKGIPYVPSPLLYRGVIYLIKDGGILTTLDALTGRVLKQARVRGTGTFMASPIAGDGKVYVISDKGVITVLKAVGDWEILSSHDLEERTVATPVIAEGKVFVRTEKAVYCFRK